MQGSLTLTTIHKAVKQLTASQKSGHDWAVQSGGDYPAHAKLLTELGFDFKTRRFDERKPLEEGKDYTIPGPDFAYEDLEAQQMAAVALAGIPEPISIGDYYIKALVANLKANMAFTAIPAKKSLPEKSGTAYQMYSYPDVDPDAGGSQSE